MVNIDRIYRKIHEDAAFGGGIPGPTPAGSGEGSSSVIGTGDVLGRCDHEENGFMGHGCFHIPAKVKTPKKRFEPVYGGSGRRRKTPYEKGMKFISDSEDEKKISKKTKEKAKKAESKAPGRVQKIAKLVKNKKQVKKTLEEYDRKRKELDKKLGGSSLFKSLKDTVTTMALMLKDIVSGRYKVQWSTVAILTAALFYVLSPVDLIPDAIPVVGLVDDAAVISWTQSALKDEFQEYKKWRDAQKA